ncbi:class I SAM-dependent DNA methyltransferase [Desulfitobacterium sp.]|uniref:type I restriction-modification system subunit M n=1 Tax=Desulfitobacterium sp. TaxID=49981 RepID=UPI002B21F057|nr:class I SAM-dependent DNA methyltransferase [Desulfitobacterium sp.]MEA4900555.1 class I SAM-dependent DNA methyltransferase [Desulfitobacterium sp.]
MNQTTYNSLKAFIWGIANDCLVDVYDVGDYRKVILPFFVIRRFDAVLMPKHDDVVKKRIEFEKKGITVDIDPALCTIAGQAFCNRSDYTLTDLKSRTNQQQLKRDFIAYLDGFSQNVQEILSKFKIRNEIDTLSEHDRLGLLIEKFVDPRYNFSTEPVLNDDGTVRIEGLDNHSMGTLFEDVIRQFNEETNITDAGRHFTPRDIVELMADLAFIPVQDQIQSTTYRIYDGACGTGGMLTVGEQHIQTLAARRGKRVSIKLFGQENADETYAIARADMLVKGEGAQANNIRYGSTISEDRFAHEEFDFMLSNPPFGTSWKSELKAWGDIKKDDISDPRFIIEYDGNPEFSLVPDIGDPQMLFLANNISKMKRSPGLKSRIVEVHSGSAMFTGKAGSGWSNLRRYIIEQDMLEAIVALPENMFYRAGISTYLWIVTNKKEDRRKGKVQLIDATSMKSALRKNLGDKNCELTPEINRQILGWYLAFDSAPAQYSKVFENAEFGYWSVDIHRPLRLTIRITDAGIESLPSKGKDAVIKELMIAAKEKLGTQEWHNYNDFMQQLDELAGSLNLKLTAARIGLIKKLFTSISEDAEPVLNTDGSPESDKNLKETAQVPLLYEGGISAFFENEVHPYVTDAWVDETSIVVGYELSFNKYFYMPIELRNARDIINDIQNIEENTDGLLSSIIGGVL